jgi:hypothetical protein
MNGLKHVACVAALLASTILASMPATAQSPSPARLTWSASEGGGEFKLGLAVPGDNTYAGLYMSCQGGSGDVRLNAQLSQKSLAPVAAAIRGNQGIEIVIKAGNQESTVYPDLVFNQHDGMWEMQARLDIDDPVMPALAAAGRIEWRSKGVAETFAGAGMARAWRTFAEGCKRR